MPCLWGVERLSRLIELHGRCLCNRVAYVITGHLGLFQYCHCSRCRKFTGSAFSAHLLVSPADFRWSRGETFVGRYEIEDAKHFATSFCTQCGSSLPWLAKTGRVVMVPAGSLEEDPGLRPVQNIFWDSRAGWYVEPSELPHHAELPPKRR